MSPDYETEAAKRGILAAAERRNYTLMRELIDNGVDVNYQDSEGQTALFILAKNDSPKNEDIEMIKYLLNHGADTNIKNKKGETAFDKCAYKICQLNPNSARKINLDDKTVEPTLSRALDEDDCATIVELIKNGVDPFIEVYGTALFFRLYHPQHRICLQEVLKLGIDLNKVRIHQGVIKEVDTALTYANRHSWYQGVIPLLQQYGAIETDDTPLIAAYYEMWDKYAYNYSEQAVEEIKQKLKQKNLKDWEVIMYKELLKHQKGLKESQNRTTWDGF